MRSSHASAVICGAGIAGVAAAYFLTVVHGLKDVVLVDPLPPLSLTSDKSTEAYRNWWPGPDDSMIALMNHSIDLMEALARQTDNRFLLNRRGYVYATARQDVAEHLRTAAERAQALGAGPVRVHIGPRPDYRPAPAEGFQGQPEGADILTHPEAIRTFFPYLNPRTRMVLHVRRAGWLSAHQLGMYLLETARAHGAQLWSARVVGVEMKAGRVFAVRVQGEKGKDLLRTDTFINAAGPFVHEVAAMVGASLPILHERHTKVAFNDYLGVIPRDAPLLIWSDPQRLPWSEEERAFLEEEGHTELLREFPGGAHVRPEGAGDSPMVLMLWAYDTTPVSPVFPVPMDPLFPEIVLRGLTAMLPGLETYWERAPKPALDGGYYTKTPENLPLIGPLEVEGAYVIGALAGFGIMASLAAGELLAAHVMGDRLPAYAPAFLPRRYKEPDVYPLLSRWSDSWQL